MMPKIHFDWYFDRKKQVVYLLHGKKNIAKISLKGKEFKSRKRIIAKALLKR